MTTSTQMGQCSAKASVEQIQPFYKLCVTIPHIRYNNLLI